MKSGVVNLVELSDGWGLELTIARFHGPRGTSWQGVGLTPDFPIPAAKSAAKRTSYTTKPRLDPEADPQLRAAISIIGFDRSAGK